MTIEELFKNVYDLNNINKKLGASIVYGIKLYDTYGHSKTYIATPVNYFKFLKDFNNDWIFTGIEKVKIELFETSNNIADLEYHFEMTSDNGTDNFVLGIVALDLGV